MKTKLVAVIALIFCAFMAEASKVEGNGNIITKEISVDSYPHTRRDPYQTDPVCNRRKLEDSEILKDFRPDGF